jgi:hypothetical protein
VADDGDALSGVDERVRKVPKLKLGSSPSTSRERVGEPSFDKKISQSRHRRSTAKANEAEDPEGEGGQESAVDSDEKDTEYKVPVPADGEFAKEEEEDGDMKIPGDNDGVDEDGGEDEDMKPRGEEKRKKAGPKRQNKETIAKNTPRIEAEVVVGEMLIDDGRDKSGKTVRLNAFSPPHALTAVV